MKTKQIRQAITNKRKKTKLTAKDFVSTGSTLLNLACTGYPERGFAKGYYYFIVGDSVSGKTFIALTCLAEASINPNFKNYRFIYDNGEDGALMDIEKFFGKAVMKRLESLCISETIEDFYYNVDDAIKQGTPFIYILDSMDSLSSHPEIEKFDETKKLHRRGKETTGSYGDGKAKMNSSNLRRLLTPLKEMGSILIILNQTRDNIGATMFQPKKTRSGGHALRFYASIEMWSSMAGHIKKTVNNKARQLGINSRIQIKKNRMTGRERTVNIPIYHSFGIDDVGSCIDYLLAEGYWKNSKQIITAKGLGVKGSRKKLIKTIEQKNLEKDLQELVRDVWDDIEQACEVQRKSRYE